ncbi:MAG: class I SAM-dependent methyltransferase [Neisseriaceae bacterium]|nr:MAG: class I SAM-dependent methyltransferase [Neisseriaceae bacterium]
MIKSNFLPLNCWNKIVDFAVLYGCDKQQVIEGSMPKYALDKILEIISGQGLQIGGFVGVSHCYLARNLNGTICTIDANIPHRGVNNPLLVVSKLVENFKLQNNSMLIHGYAIEQMKILIKHQSKFDFILLDGNHNFESLKIEIELADKLLKTGGFLILDDIDYWDGPKKLYENFNLGYEKIGSNKRAGILKKL